MSQWTPAHPPQPVELSFRVRMSPAWLDAHVAEHGTRPADTYTFSLKLAEIDDRGLRERFVSVHRAVTSRGDAPVFEGPVEDANTFLGMVELWLAERTSSQPEDPFGTEMHQWIEERGSDRLRLAFARGYKVNATYARERAAHEFPGYWADTNNSAMWRDRTDPSSEALEAQTEADAAAASHDHPLNSRIVWLTVPPRDLIAHLEHLPPRQRFSQSEAVTLTPFLGRYSLIRPLRWPAPVAER